MDQKKKNILLFLFLFTFLLGIVLFSQSRDLLNSEDKSPLSSQSIPSGINLTPRIFDHSQVNQGVNLIPLSGPEKVYLTDLEGNVLNEWNVDAARARLLPDCSLLVIHGSKEGLRRKKWRDLKPFLRIYGREGEVLWEHTQGKVVHHDTHRLNDQEFVFLQSELVDFPDGHRMKPVTNLPVAIRSDSIQIVNRDSQVRWRWFAHEHLDLEECDWNGCEKKDLRERDQLLQWDWTHINTVSPLPENTHAEKGDKRFRPGNFLVIPRNFWTAYIVAHPSGEIVWRYGGLEAGDPKMIRGHEAHMVPKGFPGAGNILLFDNGYEGIRSYSRIREIDPVTEELVWSYEDPSVFFSVGGGSVQRLSNGNTLISEDIDGRIFEVSRSGEIVWEVETGTRISRARRYPASRCST